MATTMKWAAPGEAIQTALSTGLDALGSGNTALSAEIPNETDLYLMLNLSLSLASVNYSGASGLYVSVWVVTALDGTNFEDGTAGTPGIVPARAPDAIFPLRAVNAAQVVNAVNIPLPPLDFKLLLQNSVSAAFAANTNLLYYRRHNNQAV